MSLKSQLGSFLRRMKPERARRVRPASTIPTKCRVELLEPRLVLDSAFIGELVGRQYFRNNLGGFESLDEYAFQVSQPATLDAQLSLFDQGANGKISLSISSVGEAPADTGALEA